MSDLPASIAGAASERVQRWLSRSSETLDAGDLREAMDCLRVAAYCLNERIDALAAAAPLAPASPHGPEVAALVAVCKRLLELREPCLRCDGTGTSCFEDACDYCAGFGFRCEISTEVADLEDAVAAVVREEAPNG